MESNSNSINSINLKNLDTLNIHDEHYKVLEKYVAKITMIHKAKGLVFMGNNIDDIYFAHKNSRDVYTSMVLRVQDNILLYKSKTDCKYIAQMPSDAISMKSIFGFNNYSKVLEKNKKDIEAKL